MYKKYTFLLLFLLCLSSCAQNKVTMYSEQYKIKPTINIPLSADLLLTKASEEFKENFKIITGEILRIERSNGFNKNYSYVVLRINPTQKKSYCFYKKGKNITIQGTDYQSLVFGINAFFKNFTSLNYKLKINKEIDSNNFEKEINIPNEFSYCNSPEFEYREPYFSTNFNPKFRNWNKTNYLELEWGIWGHNLPKTLKEYNLPETAYAKVGNKRLKSQFCFTSDSLYKYVNKKVIEIYNSDNALNKYMVLPNDNNIVCSCGTCKAVGNTDTDAAPAVFTFLNKLAKNHRKSTFFSTAYISVKNVPKFKAEPNTGVFYSTIEIQKGIPIENSEYFDEFETNIKKWKKFVNNVYIWDYAVNFDNYFDIYPSLQVTQKNLKLYKKLGVNGVFIHGSEYNYSTFQELKSTIFAKLLWKTDIDINKEVNDYFNQRFPKKLAEVLSNYYTFIDKSFLVSNKKLSIYSGIDKTVKKKLNTEVFFNFYKDFDLNTNRNKYDKEYLKIATALTFLKLEIMRDYGFGAYGYASLNNKNEIIVKNEVGKLLDKLNAYSKSSKLNTYSESKYRLDEYINNWKNKIFKYHKRKHYFFKKPFEVLSKLDEDYKDVRALNNGAFGLSDYNTNWHIVSLDDLVLKIEKNNIVDAKKISISFLQDTRHAIYHPSSIEILDTDYKLIKKINLKFKQDKLALKEVTIELPNEYDQIPLPETFILKIKKQKVNGKNLLACDEIIFH